MCNSSLLNVNSFNCVCMPLQYTVAWLEDSVSSYDVYLVLVGASGSIPGGCHVWNVSHESWPFLLP